MTTGAAIVFSLLALILVAVAVPVAIVGGLVFLGCAIWDGLAHLARRRR